MATGNEASASASNAAATGANNNPLQQLTDTIMVAVAAFVDSKQTEWSDQITNRTVGQINARLTENKLAITEEAAKRVQVDSPELKKPGNKDQYVYNTEVLRCIEKAEHSFKNGEPDTGIQHLNAGKTIIAKRQKLVRLADREESGWNFVQEYTRDKLASDSDDEKQFNKAS